MENTKDAGDPKSLRLPEAEDEDMNRERRTTQPRIEAGAAKMFARDATAGEDPQEEYGSQRETSSELSFHWELKQEGEEDELFPKNRFVFMLFIITKTIYTYIPRS
ncbi:hypothetical protein NDU88_003236 [Pleurodeles waltl]|uniref:Uncharacterized protein n=1 Tax=Pleurodeles waltl TaxID=8319 RepID=A0AAV7TP56_PLEWA|nr:hypothetical protein NDU88_003236 [Pleurodeles waltl]